MKTFVSLKTAAEAALKTQEAYLSAVIRAGSAK